MTLTARAARSVPHMSALEVADRVGVSGGEMLASLRGLHTRGACAAAIRSAALEQVAVSQHHDALAYQQCPPGVVAHEAASRPLRILFAHGPASWQTAAANRSMVRWSPSLRRQLTDQPETSMEVALDRFSPPALLTRLSQVRDAQTAETFAVLAANVACPPAAFAAIMSTPDAARNAAANPKCPAGLLWRLSRNRRNILNVAANVACPPALLVALAETAAGTDRTTLRMLLAENPSCPGDALEVLSRDERNEVRLRVARHKQTPRAVLQRLAQDPDVWVRCEIANNPLCAPQVLRQMAGDKDAVVRSLVATNPACPDSVRSHLIHDPEDYVARNAGKAAGIATGR